jgi:hypothetical protein
MDDVGISQCICIQLHYWTFERGDLTNFLKKEYEALLMPESYVNCWLPIKISQAEGICEFSALLFF